MGEEYEKDKFPRLAKAFLIRVAESNRNLNLYIFLCEVPSAATPPRALQFALISIFSPQRSFFLYYLTCDMCLRFRGCPASAWR